MTALHGLIANGLSKWAVLIFASLSFCFSAFLLCPVFFFGIFVVFSYNFQSKIQPMCQTGSWNEIFSCACQVDHNPPYWNRWGWISGKWIDVFRKFSSRLSTIPTLTMGLMPLEFSDCLSDSPYFRDILHQHEKELERASKQIKSLVTECKELINAAKSKWSRWRSSRCQPTQSAIINSFSTTH